MMFKTVWTILRGRQAEAEQALADANALTILDQHIRDATADVERARRALAIARAQDESEAARVASLQTKIADLETRALAALEGGREDLAAEAAEAIAGLEGDAEAATGARAGFARETAKLRKMTSDAERRLQELERGRRAARAAEAVRRLRTRGGDALGGASALHEAEATLKRLRERQSEDEAASQALDEMQGAASGDGIAQKLESAGFGDASRPSGACVLERLRQRRAAA
jgi:phage shock protein A